jgi:uncharacterized NAD-dependent epimerase/dehydratase family protein
MDLRDAFDPPEPALVLAEGAFGTPAAKTAHGVVMHGDLFDVRAVVDSEQAGRSAADVLDQDDVRLDGIPVLDAVETALEQHPDVSAFVIGVAPAGGQLPDAWESAIEAAMRDGCDIISGLHTFLGDDPEWSALADDCGVRLFDVRKPPNASDLRVADGRIDEIDTPVVLTAGTDCAVGKRTTTFELYRAAQRSGIDAGWVATGQTGIMVGADRGVVVDRVPADFAAGVVEDLVCAVAEDRELVFVEGQGALSHRAYGSVSLALLQGAWPDAVVLVDDPGRDQRDDFEQFSVPDVEDERALVESLSDATVAGVSTWGDPEDLDYSLPTANVYHDDGPETLLDAVEGVL